MSRFPVFKAFFHKHNELNTPSLSVHFLAITCKLYPGSDLFDHFHPRHSGPAIASPWTIVISSDDLVFPLPFLCPCDLIYSPLRNEIRVQIQHITPIGTKELSVMESITSWSHFFSSTFLFSPLQSVGSQPLPKYLGKIQTRPQYAEGKGRSRKTCTTPDGPVAGLLSKGDYIRGLSQVLEDQQISPLATRIIKVYVDISTGTRPLHSLNGLSHRSLSQVYILGVAPGSRKVKWNAHSKDRGVGREPSIPRVQFQGQTAGKFFLIISLNTAMLSLPAGAFKHTVSFAEMFSSQTLPCLLLDFLYDYTEILATGCYCSVMYLFNICYLNIFNQSNNQCWQSNLTF